MDPARGSRKTDGSLKHVATTFREEAYGSYASSLGRPVAGRNRDQSHYARRLIRRHFPRERTARIVDLGCGDGTLLSTAATEGYSNSVGIDLSPEQISAAQLRGLHAVRQEDAFGFVERTPDGTVDVVLTLDILEHFTRDEVLRLAKGIQRILSTSGRWLIHVPNGSSPMHGRIRYADLTHETAYTTSSLAQLLRLAGFREFTFYEDTPVVHGVKSAVRAFGWWIARALLRTFLAIETGNSGATEVFSQNLLAVAVKRTEALEPASASSLGTRDAH